MLRANEILRTCEIYRPMLDSSLTSFDFHHGVMDHGNALSPPYDQGRYSSTVLKNILCLFLQDLSI